MEQLLHEIQIENTSEPNVDDMIRLWVLSMMQNIEAYALQNQLNLSEQQKKVLLGQLFLEEFGVCAERMCS